MQVQATQGFWDHSIYHSYLDIRASILAAKASLQVSNDFTTPAVFSSMLTLYLLGFTRMADFFRFSLILSTLMFSHIGNTEEAPLIIGAYHYPPFMDETHQNGLYVQLGKAIEAISGIKLKWVFYPYARVDRFFKLGKIDIEIGSSPVWTQHKSIPGQFTHVFYQLEDVAIYQAQKRHFYSGHDIKGQRIGMVRGYSFPQFQADFDQNLAQRVEGANEKQLLKLLLNDRIDQVFMSKLVFMHLQKHEPRYQHLQIGAIVGRYDVAIRVHPNKASIIPAFNQAIEQLKKNGTIESLFSPNSTGIKKPAEAGFNQVKEAN